MRLLHIGDIVGKPGREIVTKGVPILREKLRLDLVTANAENAAAGSGITPLIFKQLIHAGIDCITLGDHIYRRKEIYAILESSSQVVRPANYPSGAPGKGMTILETPSGHVAMMSLLGRVFMKPVDCPFTAADRLLKDLSEDIRMIVVDIHAEATSDKQLVGRYLDGRVSAVLGTHTHVTTADEQILPGGTAFQCDIGMTGPLDSILGRQIEPVLETTLTFRPTYFDVAKGDVRLHATLVEIDSTTGKATAIERVVLKSDELPS